MAKRKKKREYQPGYMPHDALAWCAYHQRGMNYPYIQRKHCLFNRQRRQCKHLQWFVCDGEFEEIKKA